jgi:hypothetical protein
MAIANTLKPYISVGQAARQLFQDTVDDFYDDFDSHLFVRGQPGVGKTYYVTYAADQRNIGLVHFEGSTTRWHFMKKMACSLKAAGWPTAGSIDGEDFDADDLPKVVVYIDDCPNVFESDFIDTLKIALEQEMSDKLVYNTSLGGQYKQCEIYEKEAIDHFRQEGEPGFTMRFYGRVKFIFTMNHALANDLTINEYKKNNKNPSLKVLNQLEDKYAIFSRVEYRDLHMSKNEYWGWIADLIYNNKLLPGATQSDMDEMLEWVYSNWDNLKDKSVRMVKQKLWKDMAKAKTRPNYDYKSRWHTLVRSGE